MTVWPPICPQCGQPVEVTADQLAQFEALDDAQAAGHVLHPECAGAWARRRDRPRARVLMYDSPEDAPLAGD